METHTYVLLYNSFFKDYIYLFERERAGVSDAKRENKQAGGTEGEKEADSLT